MGKFEQAERDIATALNMLKNTCERDSEWVFAVIEMLKLAITELEKALPNG